jgi:hypothetical protein
VICGSDWHCPGPIGKWSLTSLQQRLVKTGGRLIQHARYLLGAIGREPSDAVAVRGHAAEGRRLAHACGIRRVQRGANLDDDAGLAGEVFVDAPGKRVLSRRCVRRRRNRPLLTPMGIPLTDTG